MLRRIALTGFHLTSGPASLPANQNKLPGEIRLMIAFFRHFSLAAAIAPLEGAVIEGAGREAGNVRSTLIAGGRRIGLAPIRRDVAVGEMVTAGGRPARVVALPFGGPQVA